MKVKALLVVVAAVLLVQPLALAQEQPPSLPVNLDINRLRSLAVFIVKGGLLAAFVIVVMISFIRGVIGAAERSAAAGTFGAAVGYREMLEAFKSPLIFLLALVLLAWLPDLLAWLGLLPEALRPYAIDWGALFGG
ncbi:MAG: hypothetical protein DRK00_06550 [Thermoprotei archaeon]|nr:MAG: hypothetical protein DRK00_06550 [Thermoprotei archaeon]